MYALIAGGGKVGSNILRTLLRLGHEATLVEQRRDRYERLDEEFEHQAQHGDATEIHVLERAGIARPPDIVLALTGDDEDNLVICQIAREKYGVPKVLARVNDPRNQDHFDLLGISPTVSATASIMALIEHEVPEHELVHLLELRKENLEIVEVQLDERSPSAGKRVEQLSLPEGSRLISVMRGGRAEIAVGSTELRAGDQVLAILQPGKEDELRKVLLRVSRAAAALATVVLASSCGGGEDGAASSPSPPPARASLSIAPVARGLVSPVHVASPRSEPGRLVVEQAGRIVVVEGAKVRPEPFLDIRTAVASGGERGLLSVAFHPRYASNRRFYVNYTDTNGDTRIVEYRSNGRNGLPASARQLLFVRQPYPNHNGGQLAFGPDGALYVGMGDGGSGGDPENRAQDPRELLGKLVRINVSRPQRRKIAALGLRNPWRFSFDRANGDLWIADVGQGDWEEIDYLPRRRLGGTQNYGWDVYEGRARFEPKPLGPGRLVQPLTVYSHAGGHCSVTGGFSVYRGRAVPAARGRYFYGDYCTGVVWSVKQAGGKARGLRQEPFRVAQLSSFGEDARGELYLVSQGGTVYRLRG